MRKVAVLLAIVGLLGLAYRVEAGAKSSEGALPKIGYVNRGKVIDEYPKAKEVEESLRKEQEAKQKEMDEKREAIKKLEEELKAQASLLKEEDKKKKARVIEEKRKRWGQLFREYDMEIRNRVIAKQREVLNEVDAAVETFGKEKGYSLILDAEQVIYGLEGLDVTEEIIKLLNKTEKPSKNK